MNHGQKVHVLLFIEKTNALQNTAHLPYCITVLNIKNKGKKGGHSLVTRQFGTKTFRHPLKKTVRYQDKSPPHFLSNIPAPHFLSNIRDLIAFKKIKSKKVIKKNPSMIV